MIENEGKYYLYRHIRLDTGEPFYIGIGTKPIEIVHTYRKEYKRAFNKTTRNNFWKSIIAKTDYEVEILLESDDYEFIKQKEIEFIALYGRRDLGKGALVNLTDGGEGMNNNKQTKETQIKLYNIREKRKQDIRDKVIGSIHTVNQGYKLQIINYENSQKVTVRFLETFKERVCKMDEIVKGELKDYFYPSVCGIGYTGGKKVKKQIRDQWTTLLLNNKEKYGISKEWCNLENFAKWYEENYKVNISNRLVLRTNIFNKEPQECDSSNTYFLPIDLSQQLTKSKGYKVRKSGEISSSFLGKHLGYFKTIEEAKEKYSIVKKEHIIKLADKYRNELPEDLYYKITQHEIKFE
jgi:hypothetical protein